MNNYTMNILSLSIDHYDANMFHFLDSKPNLLMEGYFTKMIYASPCFSLNSIYLQFPIKVHPCHTNHFAFDYLNNKTVISMFKTLEIRLLELYACARNLTKKPILSISNMMNNGHLKLYQHHHLNLIMKLSGIWESETEFGVTFKVMDTSARIYKNIGIRSSGLDLVMS